MSDQDYSTEEFQRLIHKILAAEKTAPAIPVAKRPVSSSGGCVEPELSLDEILQKIRREIANEQPR